MVADQFCSRKVAGWKLSLVHLRGTVVRSPHPRSFAQPVAELLVNVDARVWRSSLKMKGHHLHQYRSKLSLDYLLGLFFDGLHFKVTDRARRSPTAGCHRPTRHSESWKLCQRWTLGTSTWEGVEPVGQSDHSFTKMLHKNIVRL